MAQYKVEFLPADLEVRKGEAALAVGTIETIINKYAGQGYELCQVAQISVLESPGCLASIFGAKSFNINYNMLVFKK